MKLQQKMGHPGGGLSPATRSAGALMLDFLVSRTVGNKFQLFISFPVYGILLLQLEQTKTRTLSGKNDIQSRTADV